MFSVKSITPQKQVLVSCTKCPLKSDYSDRFCQNCGELLPAPTETKTVVVKKPEVPPTVTGPEFLGSIETGGGTGGFTIDPKTGQKKYNVKQPPNVKK